MRFVDYTAAKVKLENITENFPVSFLFGENGHKGYNKNNLLVTIQPKGGKPLYITRELHENSDHTHYITAVQDENGKTMRFYYDEEGLLSRVVNSLGEEATFAYENGELYKITRPHAPTLTFGYDGGFLTRVTDDYAANPFTVSNFSFTSTGKLVQFSRTTDVERIVHGEIIKREETTPLTSLSLAYNEHTLSISDLLKNRKELFFFTGHSTMGTHVLENDKVVYAEKNTLDENTELLTEKRIASPACYGEPLDRFDFVNGTVERYEYNDFHECTKTETVRYTPTGNEKERVVTITLLHEKGYPLRVDTNRTLIATEPNEENKTENICERYFYNESGALVKRESYTVGKEHLLGKDIEELSYDEDGRETVCVGYNSLLPSDKLYTEKSYDSLGRVTAELDETGRFETTISYIGDTARLHTVKDVRGTTLTYAYDESGREVAVTAATKEGEADTECVYYTAGLPVCAASPRHVYNYAYDGKGRVTGITLDGWDYLARTYTENEDGTETVTTAHAGFESTPLSVTKDKFGEVKSRAREGIKNISYTYTPDGRPLTEADTISGRTKTYGYDEEYRLNSYTDSLGVTESLSYDEESRVTEKGETVNESTVTSTFFYDEDTERLAEMQTSGFDIFPSYDPLDRECKRTVWRTGHFLHEAKTDFIKYGDHATMRPSAITLSSPSDSKRLKYSYDEMGNIERIYEDGALSSRYEYDALGRLTREDNRPLRSTTLWEYDQGGNILSRRTYPFTVKKTFDLAETEPTDTLLYEYAGDHLVSLNGAESTHYSAEGHPDTYRGKPVTWYAPRMLATFDGVVLTYNSDGLCSAIDGKPLLYSRDGRLLTDGTFRYLYDESGNLFGFLCAADGAEYLYRRDALGNIVAILDNTGAVVVKYVYNAWGAHKVLSPDGTEITELNHIGNLNPHRYRGYYYSTALELYYLKSRFYDAEIGRFICADSLDYLNPHAVGGLNLYAYCNNNPVMGYDPEGTVNWNAIGNIALAAIGVILVTSAIVATAGVAAVTLGASTAVVSAVTVGAAVGGIAAGASELVSQCVTVGAENLDVGAVAIETFIGSAHGVVDGIAAITGSVGVRLICKSAKIALGETQAVLRAFNEGRTSDIACDFATAKISNGFLQSGLILLDYKQGNLSVEGLLNRPRRYGAKQAALTALVRVSANLWTHREDFKNMFYRE